MYFVICIDRYNNKSVSSHVDKEDARDEAKRMYDRGETDVRVAKEMPLKVERITKVSFV